MQILETRALTASRKAVYNNVYFCDVNNGVIQPLGAIKLKITVQTRFQVESG